MLLYPGYLQIVNIERTDGARQAETELTGIHPITVTEMMARTDKSVRCEGHDGLAGP